MSLARTDDRPRMQTGGGAQARRHGPTGEYLMPLNIEWTKARVTTSGCGTADFYAIVPTPAAIRATA